MSTVIIGGGIIGTSIAYHLANSQSFDEVHIVETSPELFSAASGYAAGFLAKYWFVPSLAPLGAMSFDMHADLAARKDGKERWGYMKGTALRLHPPTWNRKDAGPSGDWLRAGTTEADGAVDGTEPIPGHAPAWLTTREGEVVEQISEEDTTGVVDPLRLSHFLMDASLAHGVQLHHPAKARRVVTDESGTITGVRIEDLKTGKKTTLPCTNLVISAGPWSHRVFKGLFPASTKSIPVSHLAGYSILLRSPRYQEENGPGLENPKSNAIFTTQPETCGFSPEIFSRQGGELYIAGLNPSDIPFPKRAEDTRNLMKKDEVDRLKTVAVRLLGKVAGTKAAPDIPNTDDLQVIREGLCFRPISTRGTPIITKIDDASLGNGIRTGSKGQDATGRNVGGVFVAAGHGPWGISLSLGTGKVITEMIDGMVTSVNIRRLSV